MDKQQVIKLLIGDLTWQRLVKSLIFIYLFFAAFVYFRADSMIFLSQPSSYQDDPTILKLRSGKDTNISATYLLNTQAKYTILYSHGNSEDLGDIKQILEKLHAWGFSVFAFDYRGYGTSQGKPTESHAYEDINSAYNYLTQNLKIPPERIIVLGRSVGGGSAVNLAMHKPVAGLIIESSFISAFQVIVPFRILPFDKFPNLKNIKKVKCPILVIHGKADNIIPFTHGEKLFNAAKSPKLSLWVEEANHNDLFSIAEEKYRQTLQDFTNLVKANQQLSRLSNS
ncbi:alpha/beta hydrolase [Nostoc sp. 'Peltigera membranacea cyanobiont' 210A]|uniref:alpha/beta hydrolase n=1 Tax=Nostoc sp. 'Peltigera membranacea cyanobiont' 210A TaxID=2014529 RepID=UPI000B951EAF|nr:alpha/beta hydrolase [Nostoc sp. 'Peltigera membranacea cyanobiont' 210A]OYD97964.1 alpha/beta hydrolase [Nostoc sp. 'Peltigera membranacea cyanobiont' 210A]